MAIVTKVEDLQVGDILKHYDKTRTTFYILELYLKVKTVHGLGFYAQMLMCDDPLFQYSNKDEYTITKLWFNYVNCNELLNR